MRARGLSHATSPRLALLAAAALAAASSQGRALGAGQASPPQAVPAIPRFTQGRVEQVTVDVVVLDRKGQPVTGLTRDDFTILEEGQPRAIASFDLVNRSAGAPGALAPEGLERVATNVGQAAEEDQLGRTFVVLFDDLNLTFVNAGHAKRAVAAFLDRGTVEGDRVTLLSSSGSAWWNTRMKGGREDLLAILKRVDGHRVLENPSERITDFEALQIVNNHDVLVAGRVQDRLDRYGTTLLRDPNKAGSQDAQQLFQRGVVDPFVESLALRTYSSARTRTEKTLAAIERATRALGEGRSRKALLLVSEGFVDDPTTAGPRRVVDAARRVNATVYFIDAGGLKALDPMYSAELGPALDSADTMTAIADLSREGEGAAALAERTGGFSIRGSNTFEEGAVRIGRESQSFYLLGYNPGDIPRDGRFRKIDVKVRGSYTVRARRGYYAPSADDVPELTAAKGVDAILQHALDAPRPSDAIPLRMTAYVLDGTGPNHTRVVVAADADVSRVEFRDVEGKPQATLDTLVVVAPRDSGEALRTDQTVDIQRRPGVSTNGPMWYSFLREFSAAAGEHQVKLVVRDKVSNRVGTVSYRFNVPASDEFHVSTPVLTDVLANSGSGGAPVMLIRRTFPASAQLYCRFDVFGAAKGPDGLPRVRAGYQLRRGGEVVGRANPTLIEPTSLGALARMVQIPLAAFRPGDYEMVLTVSDELGGKSRELVEPFSVTPPATTSHP